MLESARQKMRDFRVCVEKADRLGWHALRSSGRATPIHLKNDSYHSSPLFARLTRNILICFAFFLLAGPFSAFAHEGPPFPIVMDKPLADYVVSVWADPDIGDAQFYIIVETPDGGMPAETPRVTLWTEPISGRLERVSYETAQQTLRNQLEFEAAPYFDRQDHWTIGIQITPPGGEKEELTTEVESTPPGYGRWDFAIYLFPFVFLGGFWVAAMVRRNRLRHVLSDDPAAEANEDEQRKGEVA